MKSIRAIAVLASLMLTVPALGFAQSASGSSGRSSQPAQSKPAKKPAPSPMAAMKGVVKSVNDTQLVITTSGAKKEDLTFSVTSATQRQGMIAVGATVNVRYRMDGTTRVATAIRAPEAKSASASKPATSSKPSTSKKPSSSK